MKDAIKATYTDAVLSDTGSFGGLFALTEMQSMRQPVLVASTDGVGTKTMVAARMEQWDTVGQDLVNHCINDILVQGAHPLFFMDYVASSQLQPEQIAAIVRGMAVACKAVGCALLGGETAEMPGVYASGEIDVVGTVVGIIERDQIIDGQRIAPGDVILALPSTGLHTNGYSLARRVLRDVDWNTVHTDLGVTPGDALLAVHHCYLQPVQQLRAAGIEIRGLAHITGGGVIDNLPRILPEGCQAIIQRGSWPMPPIFALIQNLGNIPDAEMWRVFNMGLGMLVIVPREHVGQARASVPDLHMVGEIIPGTRQVEIRG
jgi:phosphoribosylformylglycinamidine cyclo-ligase